MSKLGKVLDVLAAVVAATCRSGRERQDGAEHTPAAAWRPGAEPFRRRQLRTAELQKRQAMCESE